MSGTRCRGLSACVGLCRQSRLPRARTEAAGHSREGTSTRDVVTVITAVIVGLTFLFGFGNVLSLGLRPGVSGWVAPLVAPAVDLSVLALLLAMRYLAVHGAMAEHLRPARRLLMFSSVVTFALNVADPLIAGMWGKAAFDAVGPLLLIGWAEVGPGLLPALARPDHSSGEECTMGVDVELTGLVSARVSVSTSVDDLLERARLMDAEHGSVHQRPVSADTLRRNLGIVSRRARDLVAHLRQAHLVATDDR